MQFIDCCTSSPSRRRGLLTKTWMVMKLTAIFLFVGCLEVSARTNAQTVTLSALNAAEEVLAYARAHNATKIVVGKPTHPRWRDKVFGSMLDQLVRGSGDVDVYVITGDVEGEAVRRA